MMRYICTHMWVELTIVIETLGDSKHSKIGELIGTTQLVKRGATDRVAVGEGFEKDPQNRALKVMAE